VCVGIPQSVLILHTCYTQRVDIQLMYIEITLRVEISLRVEITLVHVNTIRVYKSVIETKNFAC
jgi:hypothetical protein